MPLSVLEIRNKADLKTFIYLPEKIHHNHPNWVHPLYIDEWQFFDRTRNKSFSLCDTTMAIAWDGTRPVGRIMGIVNRQYNQRHNEKNSRFCFLECYEDISIARALVDYIEKWAGSLGMTRLVGPLAFSDKDPQGIIIEGFNERVLIATNYNYPWMKDFLENLGFEKEVDLVSYKVAIPDEIPGYLERIYQRAIKNNGYVIHEFTTRRKLKPWIVPIFRLINETYNHIYGFIPLEEKEMYEMANRYLPVLNPMFIKVITDQKGEVIAFVISMPELSEGIRKARGRLFPIGWYYILRERKQTKLLSMLLGAIKKLHRGKGLDSLLGMKLLQSANKAGMKIMDSHLILEYNRPMRAEFERIGGSVHKRYRIFGKNIGHGINGA